MIFSHTPNGRKTLIFALILLFVGVICWAFTAGNYDISVYKTFAVILNKLTGINITDTAKMDQVIVWDIRTPRIIMAVLTGIALASAGTAYQGCFRNPLVEPFILGASSGAAFGAALAILYPSMLPSLQLSAFVFSISAVLLSYFLAKRKSETPTVALILSGVIIGSIFSAFVSISKYLSADTQLREITFWMMGGLYYSTWSGLLTNALLIIFVFVLIWVLGWKLNVLSMGDEEARSLGVNPDKYRAIFIVAATLITAVSVSSVGIIAWVGLMAPHAARIMAGPDNRFVIPISAILGAIYLVFCDTVARTLTDSEIPIGIITSIIGAPFLIALLRSGSKRIFG